MIDSPGERGRVSAPSVFGERGRVSAPRKSLGALTRPRSPTCLTPYPHLAVEQKANHHIVLMLVNKLDPVLGDEHFTNAAGRQAEANLDRTARLRMDQQHFVGTGQRLERGRELPDRQWANR